MLEEQQGISGQQRWRANRQTTLFYAVAEDSPASGQDSKSD